VKLGILCLALMIALAALARAQTVKTFTNLDDSSVSSWGSCSNCAGGQNLADIFWVAPFQTSPSRDGHSTELYISAAKPFANVLFWRKIGAQDWSTHITWDFWVYLDNASLNAQALEYDAFQFVGGREYMFGTECVYPSGHWNVWNQQAGTWVQTSLACKRFTPNVWHHIVMQFHRTSDTMMHFDSVTLDGVLHTLNLAEGSGPLPSGWTDNVGVQWQMDTAGAPLTFSEWIDNVKLTVY
jgi:hypothetical protein